MVETIKRFYTQLWDMIPIIDKEKTYVVELLEKLIIITVNSQQEAEDEC